jgi:hypothetical protein
MVFLEWIRLRCGIDKSGWLCCQSSSGSDFLFSTFLCKVGGQGDPVAKEDHFSGLSPCTFAMFPCIQPLPENRPQLDAQSSKDEAALLKNGLESLDAKYHREWEVGLIRILDNKCIRLLFPIQIHLRT